MCFQNPFMPKSSILNITTPSSSSVSDSFQLFEQMNHYTCKSHLLHFLLKFIFFLLFLIPLSHSISTSTSTSTSITKDADILLRIKANNLQDSNALLNDWNESTPDPPCDWTGIDCDHSHNVVSVNLSNLGLSGTFPEDFCLIQSLRILDLSDNYFTGDVSPQPLTLCSHLHFLNLSANLFVGELPGFLLEFSNLTSLDLAQNNFSGGIPMSYGRQLPKLQVLRLFANLLNGSSFPGFLCNLSELTWLEIGLNPFEPSPIPLDIGRLTKLEYFWLYGSNLVGNIPESIGSLTSLKNLDLSGNYLTGKFPESIGKLRNIEQIELFFNQLSGQIPDSFENLTSLYNFDVSVNNLTGKIPESLTLLSLQNLHLNDNDLEGEIPDNLALNEKLTELHLFNNRLSGSLPVNLGLNSDLEDIDVSNNSLEGPLPPNLCSKKNLERLILFDNKFSGPIPETYAGCSSLTYVRISNNFLTGILSNGFWGLPGLTMFQVENNMLEGSIPPTVSNAKWLSEFQISGNKFSGKLPPELCEFEELVKLDISRNQISGEFPSCLTNLSNLERLLVQENKIGGNIPRTITNWTDLSELNLSNNQFTGEIPHELGKLRKLTYLDLSRNLLSGEIPVELADLKLNILNLSNNKLVGRVPSGFENKAFISGLVHNPGLCSPDLKPLPPCQKRRTVSLSIISILAAVSVLLVLLLISMLIKPKNLNPFKIWHKKSCIVIALQSLGFKEDEILEILTSDNLIATGSSGQVHKVQLKDGRFVAVKRLWGKTDSDEVFQSEVKTLGSIKHRNIVKLLFSWDCKDFRILGYEYMENGSLGDVLHSDVFLDWSTRYMIATGTAQGLAYLHHDCVQAIVHRDVKSNNILLDKEFMPKVADFGLARTLERHTEEEGGDVMSQIAGSYGYIAPEYAYTLKINEKSDVYSFGVVLLELITGKRPNDPILGDNKDLVKWVSEVALSFPEQDSIITGGYCYNHNNCHYLDCLIDPRLNPSPSEYQEIKKLFNIAFQCISSLPINRPSMRRVVELIKANSSPPKN